MAFQDNDLIGINEIAEIANVSRQAVANWRVRFTVMKRLFLNVVEVVAEEATRNPDFCAQLEKTLTIGLQPTDVHKMKQELRRHKKGRRAAAVLDPIDLARQDVSFLRVRLSELDLEKLLDIVAQYGMDPGKLVMKWKDRDRVMDKIIELSLARATKGDAFRES